MNLAFECFWFRSIVEVILLHSALRRSRSAFTSGILRPSTNTWSDVQFACLFVSWTSGHVMCRHDNPINLRNSAWQPYRVANGPQLQALQSSSLLRRGKLRLAFRASGVAMPDWAQIRADTPSAEKVLHFNNAGGVTSLACLLGCFTTSRPKGCAKVPVLRRKCTTTATGHQGTA